jgi:hypothetical protein
MQTVKLNGHAFSQPEFEKYRQAKQNFARQHAWFTSTWLGGRTHFPTLESPAAISERIAAFGQEGQG